LLEKLCVGLMRDPLDRRPIGAAWEVAIPVDDMGVGRARRIAGQREARDEGADAHLPMCIDIGHLPHDEMPALPLDEVAFVPQPLEVEITTEQFA
jgi:hypothetical protein